MDVPRHFYDDGPTLTDIAPHQWVFHSVCLLDVPCRTGRLIGIMDVPIDTIPAETDLLLIRTGFESFRDLDVYWKSYPGLDPNLCEEVRRKTAVRAIGFDFISLTSPLYKAEGKLAHLILLKETNGRFVMIVEDMRLAHLQKTPIQVTMLPLWIENGNGSPVTILAEE